MTKQYAIDKAKLYYRENGRSYYVVQLAEDECIVLDRQQLERGIGEGQFRKEAIIFSIEID
ncbi:MAG TPA: hypothetical protein VMS09_03725 [Paenibacillus sp.]|uniref:hypothetical protein n=1 Tax=Paenibacillus sp. TaxID=58172 RepID=UPI0028D3126E|nr:hypothetical protein [Paenibacillus sp.]HUC91123.1 hypothetical protein [Paenibacillus sp.]